MLTRKQDRFCLEYIKDMNATAAARRAGYSEKTADKEGSRLLGKPHVQERLAELRAEIAKDAGIQVKTVVDELVKVAFSNITDILADSDGLKVKPFEELTQAQKAAIAEISETTNKYGTTKRVKMHPKLMAMDMLMKHLGGYVTAAELIDRLPPERLEELVNQILEKIQK